MSTFLSISWLRKNILVVGAVIGLVALVTILNAGGPKNETFIDKNGTQIPIPFLQDSSSLKGRVTFYGKRNGLDVYEVTYANGETAETFVPDRVYLVHIPSANDIVDAPLDAVLSSVIGNTRNVDYFGYKYSDSVATAERANINASLFATRFPAQFFASGKARTEDTAHGNILSLFEQMNNVVFKQTDGSAGSIRLDPTGSLYVFVVNEMGGANLSVRRTGVCGNSVLDPTEQCDDGNDINTDACTNECFYGIPIPFGSGSTVCGDGKKEGTEACDDGGTQNGNGCSATCTIESGYTCTGTPSICTLVQSSSSSSSSVSSSSSSHSDYSSSSSSSSAVSSSSSSQTISSSSSSSSIPANLCGNGVINGNEECDDGNTNNTDDCNNQCRLTVPFPDF